METFSEKKSNNSSTLLQMYLKLKNCASYLLSIHLNTSIPVNQLQILLQYSHMNDHNRRNCIHFCFMLKWLKTTVLEYLRKFNHYFSSICYNNVGLLHVYTPSHSVAVSIAALSASNICQKNSILVEHKSNIAMGVHNITL